MEREVRRHQQGHPVRRAPGGWPERVLERRLDRGGVHHGVEFDLRRAQEIARVGIGIRGGERRAVAEPLLGLQAERERLIPAVAPERDDPLERARAPARQDAAGGVDRAEERPTGFARGRPDRAGADCGPQAELAPPRV